MSLIRNKWIYCLFILIILYSCKKDEYSQPTTPETGNINLSIDKARYQPGEVVNFSSDKSLPVNTIVRYKHLSTVISEENISGDSWTWTAPSDDFRGYMVELYTVNDSKESIIATIGIDVSSDWSRFPRYGFLSGYGDISEVNSEAVIKNLNRHHINGLQFYDWQYKHHMPLAGTPSAPQAVWKDIANRDIYFSTLEKYVELCHQYNMKAMFYNLAFGALNDAGYDGVKVEWYIFTDENHSNKDKHSLPQPPFKSDIFLLNPGNTDWQNYINNKHKDVYAALDFDGFHIDQLGYRETRYDYWGNTIYLPETYASFITAAKSAATDKRLVMNAVNQYGQTFIENSEVDFLYTEVWEPNESYSDLAEIIQENNKLSNYSKNTVLAAYMNYDLAEYTGYFNTPAVLLTDAVIFAFGGAHLELGEHMLAKPYFPDNNLEMRPDLRTALISYYDFIVAYQNILRDGGSFNTPTVSSTDGKTSINQWPPSGGQVSVVGKSLENKQIVHLLNFTNVIHLDWRDNAGNQPYPDIIYDCAFSVTVSGSVKNVWFASPDYNDGASIEIPFTNNGGNISFELPLLQYWDMVVIEYQ